MWVQFAMGAVRNEIRIGKLEWIVNFPDIGLFETMKSTEFRILSPNRNIEFLVFHLRLRFCLFFDFLSTWRLRFGSVRFRIRFS
ncbi:hypothetical protein Fuma_02925 [Fuerstiella marisgermanici]|uniref:Uncharacterized protein n=1 Tax=Fuerstiella marisgermanici TaxID=1891926 RepID=A0A1P8WGY1_9PLAN|nr:hypothetical protein Fuma_02925 [Fuerstiella marisgermanici]